MGNEPRQEKHYNEKQVAAIIKRASELQNASTDAASNLANWRGLTASEIEQVASELGLQSNYIMAALDEFEHNEDRTAIPLLSGAHSSQEMERFIPGELTDTVWEEIIAEVHTIYNKAGTVSKVGSRYEWAWRDGKSSLIVRAAPLQGKFRLQMVAHYGDTVETTWIVAGVIALLSWLLVALPVGETLPDWVRILLVICVFGGGYGITRTALASWYRREHEKMKKLFSRVEALTASAGKVEQAQSLPAHRHDPAEETREQSVSS